MKADLAAMKEKSASSSDSGGGRRPEEPCDTEFPPKHKKWDFPRFWRCHHCSTPGAATAAGAACPPEAARQGRDAGNPRRLTPNEMAERRR